MDLKVKKKQRPYTPYGAARLLWGCKDEEILIEGPAGCVAGETRLYLPDKGTHVPIAELCRKNIAPFVLTINGPRQATVPFLKGFTRLYRVTIDNDVSIVVTEDHKFLTPIGWKKLSSISVGDSIMRSDAFRPQTNSDTYLLESRQDDRRWMKTLQDSEFDYRVSSRSYGGRLGEGREQLLDVAQEQCDVLEHTHADPHEDAGAYVAECSRLCRSSDPLSMLGYSFRSAETAEKESLQSTKIASQSSYLSQVSERFQTAIYRQRPVEKTLSYGDGKLRLFRDPSLYRASLTHSLSVSEIASISHERSLDEDIHDTCQGSIALEPPTEDGFSSHHCRVRRGTVSSIEYVRSDFYFDLHVPGEEHYLAEGIWNHNTGKSRGVAEKIHFMCMKYPGCRALITRKTRESMTESVLVTFEDQVVPEGSPLLDGVQRRLRASYKYPNGSALVVIGMDNWGKIMSTEYDVIGVFEATELTEEDWESLTTRLRGDAVPYQQIIGDCNPRAPSHWLNKRCNARKTTRLLSRHRDNPRFFDHKLRDFTDQGRKYLKKLDRLSGVRRMRLLEGKWAASEGMVYDMWDERIHVIDKMPVGWEGWKKVRGIDFGFNNPFVCLWAAINHDGDIYIYREMYISKRLVSQNALGVMDEDTKQVIIKGIVQWSSGEDYEVTVADHDAEDRATLDMCGVDTLPAHKEILVGIEAVKDRLREQMHGDGTKRPRIYFLRDALVERDEELLESGSPFCTVQEFDCYIYPTAKPEKAVKEEPVDKDNHGMDTLRYIVAYVDDLAGSTISVSAEVPEVVMAGAR